MDDGYPTLKSILTREEDLATINTLIQLLPKLVELEAFSKAAWKAKIGADIVKQLLQENP